MNLLTQNLNFSNPYQGQYEDQISEISDCALKRTGNLPKSFYMGACGAYNGKVWLCFDYYAENTCYSWDKKIDLNFQAVGMYS